jgi:hypothetical protein
MPQPQTLHTTILCIASNQHNTTGNVGAGEYAWFNNSPLAEQKNSFLAQLRPQAAYMSQLTFLWYTRYFLYRLNKLQRKTSAGQCFYRRYIS